MLQLARQDKERETDVAMSKVLRSIDNNLLYANSPNILGGHGLKSDLKSRTIPKAWAWDAKWAYEADFEDDEMHNQLWLRQPSDAGRFKHISPGRYLFEGQPVELKIVYGQLFLTPADGQVATLDDFLSAHPDPATAKAQDTARLDAASAASTSAPPSYGEDSEPCAPSTGGRDASRGAAGAPDVSPPSSPTPSQSPRLPRRGAAPQQGSRGRCPPLGAAWLPTPTRPRKGSPPATATRHHSARAVASLR